MKRDKWLDRYLWRESKAQSDAWYDQMHKQAYIHAELFSELFELAFPIPLAVMLYLIQFSPGGEGPPSAARMAQNCGQQLALEVLADFLCIFHKSKYQRTFYTVAFTNFVSRKQILLCAGITASVVSAHMNLMMGSQLRVALTHDGHYITLL